MSKRNRVRDVVGLLLVSTAVGLVIASTAYLCAYYTQRDQWSKLDSDELDRVVEVRTRHELVNLQKAIEEYRQADGSLPANLSELEEVKGQHRFQVDADGQVMDPWKHPYQYRIAGESFILYSFGRDGQPGGDGFDADIYPTSVRVPIEPPTLREFTFDHPTKGVQWTCFLAGLCASLVCLLPSRNRRGTAFLARVCGTAVGAFLIAVVISSLHTSGH